MISLQQFTRGFSVPTIAIAVFCGLFIDARSMAGSQETYTALYTLLDKTGWSPECTLLEVSPGVFLGTLNLDGTVETRLFRITSTGDFAVVSILSKDQTGAQTEGSLMQASNGSIYGSSMGYGPNGLGTIFRVGPGGAAAAINTQIGISTPLTQGSDT